MAAANLLAEIAETFAALDFAAENAEIESLTAESARLHVAIFKAEDRCTAIAQLRNEERVSGRVVADALLGDATAIEAATLSPGREAQEAERVALRAGINTLREQDRALIERRRAIEIECKKSITIAAKPLVDALVADLAALGEKVIATWAALEAVRATTSSGAIEVGKADRAMQGLMGDSALFNWRKAVPVPADVAKCLSALAGKGLAVPFQRIEAAHPHPSVSPMILLAERAA